MNTKPEFIDPNVCPICNQDNRCGNLNPIGVDELGTSISTDDKSCGKDLASGSKVDCWCQASDIAFPEDLLNTLPTEVKGKACICKACAVAATNKK